MCPRSSLTLFTPRPPALQWTRAEEAISYKMPAYRISAGPVLYFAGWKDHYSLYPASGQLVAAFQDELAPYVVSKGTIRFPSSRRVPV